MLMYEEKGGVLYWSMLVLYSSGKQQLTYKYVFGKILCVRGPSIAEN